jgi:hypothetical protein
MGRFVESSFIQDPEPCCGENSDCCSNESQLYQLDQDYVFIKHIAEFNQHVFDLPEVNSDIFLIRKPEARALNPQKILRPPDNFSLLAALQTFIL